MGISSGLGGTIGAVPVGSVTAFAGSSAPNGWLMCGGQTVSRTQYASLFSVIGTTYGAGDGSTTFALPDLRGRVPAGEDDMGGTAANRITNAGAGIVGTTLGASGGSQTHTLTESQIPSHSHGWTYTSGGGGTTSGGGVPPHNSTPAGSGGTGNTGGGGAHNNVQPTIILNYIIKA